MAAAVLSVDEVSGTVSVRRFQVESLLQAGAPLQEGDVVVVGEGGRLRFEVSRYGFAELGSGAELVLERVPSASFAEDLRTSLRLTQGVLRVVWRYPGASATWPLFVYAGNLRASLRSGEYFLQAPGENGLPLCVAGGEAAVGVPGTVRPQLLGGPSCYWLRAGESAQRQRRNEADFVPVRESLSLQSLLRSSPPGVDSPEPVSPALPAAPAAPPPASAGSPPRQRAGWVVNAASSASRAAAEEEAQRLLAAGLPAAVTEAEISGQRWYRVQLVGIADRAAALLLAKRLQTEFGYRQPWVQKP